MEVRKNFIKIPGEIKYIKEVSSKILDSLLSYKADENKLFEIKLCVEEALRNAMVHGNGDDKRKEVKVAYWIEGENSINIEIEDEGKGFDYNNVPDPTTCDNLLKGCGRGVYLIKKLMDRVEFNKTGNKIILTKRFR